MSPWEEKEKKVAMRGAHRRLAWEEFQGCKPPIPVLTLQLGVFASTKILELISQRSSPKLIS